MNTFSWILLLLTIVAWGSTPILEKAALHDVRPLDGLFIRNAAAFLVFMLFFLFTGRIKSLAEAPLRNVFLFSVSGILAGFLGMYCYYHILKINPSSKIVPLAATYPLVAAILGMVLLKEQASLSRIIGTILIIIGVVLVK